MKEYKPLPPAGGNGTPLELEKVNLIVGDGGHKNGTTSRAYIMDGAYNIHVADLINRKELTAITPDNHGSGGFGIAPVSGGHFLVGAGYSYDQGHVFSVRYLDPSNEVQPVQDGTYDKLLSDYRHVWTHTLQIKPKNNSFLSGIMLLLQ